MDCSVCGRHLTKRHKHDWAATLIKWNRLCYKLAIGAKRNPMHRACEFDDLLQEAKFALLDAARRFNRNLGFTFSTYAIAFVVGRLKSFVREQTLVHIPKYLLDNRRYKKRQQIREAVSSALATRQLPDIRDVGRMVARICVSMNEVDEDQRLPKLRNALTKLSRSEREFLLCRYGIHRPAETLREMGRHIGMSQGDARLLQSRIFTKIRRAMSA